MKKYKNQYQKMTTLAVRVDDKLLKDLDKLTMKGLTRSDIMRQALQQLISK
jgi:metal-responsive CopG/Arc/MetJ family transcriptional regulator